MRLHLSLKAGRILGCIIILLFIAAIVFCNMILCKSSKYVTPENEVNYRQYIFIPYGEEEKYLGHIGSQSYAYGPGSFAVSVDGSVYVLDSFNRKIKRYTAGGGFMYSVAIPDKQGGVDFEIKDGTIYLLCNDSGIYTMSPGDKVWTRQGYSQLKHLAGMFTANGEVYLRSWESGSLQLSSPNGLIFSEAEASPLKGESLESDLFYSCVLRSAGEESYVLLQETLNQKRPYSELRVIKYKGDEIKETALAAPLEYYIYSNPFKKLYLTQSGDVYQLVPAENGVIIFYVPWFAGEKTRITEKLIEENRAK